MAGIYIHIPFCKSRCRYCDFFSGTSLVRKEELLAALHGELAQRASLPGVPSPTRIDTLYFGGGTPSLLTPQELGALVARVRELWPDAPLSEVTAEANPDDLTPAYLDALRREGVNRLSIGIQSFIDSDLEWMHRRHDSSSAKEAVRAARRAGFDNLTIDLIYGLPQMTADQWRYNIGQALALEPEHLSAYHLTIEPQTAFGLQLQRGTLKECDPEKSREQFDLLHGMLSEAGYEHYEISNFAKPGRRALHNSNYWNGVPYLGIGPSAHSYDGGTLRQWNVANLAEYLRLQPSGKQYETECLTTEMRYNEYVMTRLRTAEGLSAAELGERFGAHKLQYFLGQVQKYVAAGSVMLIPDNKCGRAQELHTGRPGDLTRSGCRGSITGTEAFTQSENNVCAAVSEILGREARPQYFTAPEGTEPSGTDIYSTLRETRPAGTAIRPPLGEAQPAGGESLTLPCYYIPATHFLTSDSIISDLFIV